jgi:hypothetical protein
MPILQGAAHLCHAIQNSDPDSLCKRLAVAQGKQGCASMINYLKMESLTPYLKPLIAESSLPLKSIETGMYLAEDKALLCLTLLLEGNSLRSIERITGVTGHTLLDLLIFAGEKCKRLMSERIKGIAVKDVGADEIWGFVKFKNRHKLHKRITDPHVGDAYTFVGIERNTKLILAWHLGERDMAHTEAFTEKLNGCY